MISDRYAPIVSCYTTVDIGPLGEDQDRFWIVVEGRIREVDSNIFAFFVKALQSTPKVYG